ncbi:MAG: class I SAM-dependent methyltransferase [Sphingobacteriales bacterium JAD_PAG50586_3]|nr:MAG: class I SAM-dependent methyltransferase [Sphingobacteriales bacterium JAD_PAG50586_3]
MNFLPTDIERYAEDHTSPESDLLARINRDTYVKHIAPRMLSGHLQGRVLSMLTHMIKPRRVLEVGAYTGYSALCIAEGLADGGKLTTIEANEELKHVLEEYFFQSPYSNSIELIIGDAKEVIPTLDELFDLVFIDADKYNYPLYYELLIDKIPAGGYIIADNVLWSGKVVADVAHNDYEAKAILEFNAKVQADDRVENVLLPVRDGLMILRKK